MSCKYQRWAMKLPQKLISYNLFIFGKQLLCNTMHWLHYTMRQQQMACKHIVKALAVLGNALLMSCKWLLLCHVNKN